MARRPYQLIRPAGINSQGLQVLTIHQVRRPCHFTRSAGLVNSPGPQALSMHQCRRPYQSTRPALRSGTCSGPDMSLHVPFCLESTSPALRSGTCSGPDMSLRVMTRSAGLLKSQGFPTMLNMNYGYRWGGCWSVIAHPLPVPQKSRPMKSNL